MANEPVKKSKDEIKDLPRRGKPLSDDDLAGVAGGVPPGSGGGGLHDSDQHMSDTEVDD